MKVITLGQFERDLDRILDDVTDENEHYCVALGQHISEVAYSHIASAQSLHGKV